MSINTGLFVRRYREVVSKYSPNQGGSLQPQEGGSGAGVSVKPSKKPIKAGDDDGGGGVVLSVHCSGVLDVIVSGFRCNAVKP